MSVFSQVSLPNLEKLEVINLQNLETLGHGPLSFRSLSKLKQIYVSDCSKLLTVFPSQLLPTLRDLDKLTVELECRDASEPNTDVLSPVDITLCYLPKLNYISKRDPVVFRYIHSLYIFKCDSLRYVFAPTMTKSIPQLRELKIWGCKVLSRIVAEENGLGESSVDEVEFPQLARLKLQNLPNLVAIPSLKYLELQQLKNPSDLWFSELPTGSFSKLKELEVIDCENLRTTFHPSMVEALANLETLVIRNCSKMEAVVNSEEKGQGRKIEKAMFPQLRKLELHSLPNLRMFRYFTWPSDLPLLRQKDIRDCPSMDAFSLGHLSFPKLCLPGTSSKDILNHPR
ncbi:hypothetical protein Vadar_030219 [Vaccinium darrowii]|uniref:Uncharacterized protein n=1 Tax=Vaccinium darrowii TaxID=229202 RepID=A0ACB7Y328_9ERIC|nr:hypothetical protein Vadar_030219 [Vaccinium darrowii]